MNKSKSISYADNLTIGSALNLPNGSTFPASSKYADIHVKNDDVYYYNSTASWRKLLNEDYTPSFTVPANYISTYTNSNIKVSTALVTLTVTNTGIYTINVGMTRSSNLTLTNNVYANEVSFELQFTNTPSNIYSWSVGVCNGDNEDAILQAKIVGGIPSTSTFKVKLFSGSGVKLGGSALATGSYTVSVTIFSN